MKKARYLLLFLTCFFLTAAGLIFTYQSGLFLPNWIQWQREEYFGVADEPEMICLEEKSLCVLSEGEVVWRPEDGVKVQSFLWCDINHDRAEELLLLCWKQGRYGDSKPFWEERDERSWSQHIFIYQWTGETMQPIWMASELGRLVVSWEFNDTQRLLLTDRNGAVTAWDWVSWGLSNIPVHGKLSFGVLGDNLIHRQIYDYAFRHLSGNFADLYAPLAEELASYDVRAIQQEGLYVEAPSDYASFPLIGTPIQVGDALAGAGFSVVSCAGNHALDFGLEAIDRTADFFADRGILCPGIQPASDGVYRPYALLEQNGIRCGLLGFTQSTNGHCLPEGFPYVLHTLEDEELVRQALETARAETDLVVVFVHWGTEYALTPDEAQRSWGQVFADCGADVVLGTHPHVLQPWEWVSGAAGNETLVYYSLGNCISAQTEPACRLGGLAWFTAVKENGVCRIKECGLKTVETREENGRYRVFPIPAQ